MKENRFKELVHYVCSLCHEDGRGELAISDKSHEMVWRDSVSVGEEITVYDILAKPKEVTVSNEIGEHIDNLTENYPEFPDAWENLKLNLGKFGNIGIPQNTYEGGEPAFLYSYEGMLTISVLFMYYGESVHIIALTDPTSL